MYIANNNNRYILRICEILQWSKRALGFFGLVLPDFRVFAGPSPCPGIRRALHRVDSDRVTVSRRHRGWDSLRHLESESVSESESLTSSSQ